MSPGEVRYVVITATVDPGTPDGTILSNTATAASPTTDPTPGNNSATETTSVATSADLSISKSDGVTSVTAGDGITYIYTITVHNSGPSDAAGVSVSDTFPSGFARGAVTPTQGAPCVGAPSFTCALGPIASGANASISVAYTVPSSTIASPQVNSATVSATTTDNNTADNTATDSNTVATSADLSISKSDSVTSVTAGTSTTYTVTLTNNGPSDVPAGVVVSDGAPANTTISSGDSRCIVSSGTATCTTTAALTSGASTTFAIGLAVASGFPGASLTNTASITSSPVSDPTAGNDTGSDTDTVAKIAVLTVSKSGPATVIAGNQITYTLGVSNAGPSDAQAVTVSDVLPGGLVGAQFCSGVSCTPASPWTGSTSLGTIVAGGSVSLTIQASVPASTANGTILSNTATASSPTDAGSPRSSGTSNTTVNTSAELSIAKSDGINTVTAGDPTVRTYTITITNNGPSNAAGVSLSDTWPTGFSRGTVTPSQGSCSGSPSFTCSLGTIAAGANATVTVTYTVPASTTASPQVNSATVGATTSDRALATTRRHRLDTVDRGRACITSTSPRPGSRPPALASRSP